MIEISNYKHSCDEYCNGNIVAEFDATIIEWKLTLFGLEEWINENRKRWFQFPTFRDANILNRNDEAPYVAFDTLKLNRDFFKDVKIAVDKLLSKRPKEPALRGKYYKDGVLKNTVY